MTKWFLAAALTCAAITSAVAIELPPEIAKQGSIKVAIVPNYPPLEFRDPATNTLTGFDVELGEALGQEAWPQDRLAANQFRPDDARDRDGEGGCDPVRHDGYGEPAGYRDLCRLPSQWASIFRAAIARRRVQGHDGILRQKGRRQPAHVVSEADCHLERSQLRRQPDSIRRHGRIGRCPDPAKAGTDRRGRPGRRNASLHNGPRAGDLCSDRRCVRRPVHRACFEPQGEGAPASVRGGPGFV